MDNKASPMEERALTNAIERAATVASINESLDRNKLLADQLIKNSVDPKFAKTASAAFNKRLTVLTFKKTDDAHKADSFPLTDADTVYGLVTGTAPEIKVASAAPFTMDIEVGRAPAMEKAASVSIDAPELWEHRVDHEFVERHIECLLDKHAHILHEKADALQALKNKIDREATEVAEAFKKTAFDFDFTTAVNLHGDKLKNALTGYVPDYIQFEKTSDYAIHPNKEIFKKVATLIEDRDQLEQNTKQFEEYGASLAEFSNTATRFGRAMLMAKSAATRPLNTLPVPVTPTTPGLPTNTLDLAHQRHMDALAADAIAARQLADAQRQYDAARVTPREMFNEVNADFFGSALPNAIAGGGASLLAAATNMQKSIYDAGLSTLSNAYSMYQTGQGGVSPSDVLDSDFLVRDRYHDRMMAWSDMTADPQFAMYPAEEVWNAVNKAMNIDMSLERPDRREVLRAYVGQLLAQNNRVSTADIAALATTLKGLESTGGNAAERAAAGAKALGDVERKELPALKDPLAGIKTDKIEDFARERIDAIRDAEKRWETGMHEVYKQRESEAQEQRDAARQRSDRRHDAAARAEAAEQDANVRAQENYQRMVDTVNQRNAQIAYQNTRDQEQWDRALRNRVVTALRNNGWSFNINNTNGGLEIRDNNGRSVPNADFEQMLADVASRPHELAQLGIAPRP